MSLDYIILLIVAVLGVGGGLLVLRAAKARRYRLDRLNTTRKGNDE